MILVTIERRDYTLYHGTKQLYFGSVNFKITGDGNHLPQEDMFFLGGGAFLFLASGAFPGNENGLNHICMSSLHDKLQYGAKKYEIHHFSPLVPLRFTYS